MKPQPSRNHQTRRSAGRTFLLVLLALSIGAAIAWVALHRPAEPRRLSTRPAVTPKAALPTVLPATVREAPEAPSVETAPPAEPQRPEPARAQVVKPTPGRRAATPPAVNPGRKDPPPQDELARVALAFVGFDPAAEAYWYEAINDNNLSAHERQDLIEDLNEEGFADPRRPGPGELPLILSRLSLIEQVAGDAMDQVNADAFAEAYKDLVNLRDRLLAR